MTGKIVDRHRSSSPNLISSSKAAFSFCYHHCQHSQMRSIVLLKNTMCLSVSTVHPMRCPGTDNIFLESICRPWLWSPFSIDRLKMLIVENTTNNSRGLPTFVTEFAREPQFSISSIRAALPSWAFDLHLAVYWFLPWRCPDNACPACWNPSMSRAGDHSLALARHGHLQRTLERRPPASSAISSGQVEAPIGTRAKRPCFSPHVP